MKRKFFVTLILTMITVFTAILGTGCEIIENGLPEPVSIVSIEKTSSDGIIDTYTITYSDGTTSTFQVTNGLDGENGKDGKDGKDGLDGTNGEDLDIYKAYLDFLESENSNITFGEFLRNYVTFDVNINDKNAVVENLLRSVAKVSTCFVEETNPLTGDPRYDLYTGSSVIYKIEEDYTYFITNYHVVYSEKAISGYEISNDIYVYLYGSESGPSHNYDKNKGYATTVNYDEYAIPCEYVGGSAVADIAVVKAQTSKVKAINPNVCAVEFADGYGVGQTAIAIGNPNGEGISVTEGVVSMVEEYVSLSVDGTSRVYRSLRIDTSIYPGSSGGGLFDKDGKLIAITNGGRPEDEHVNFAIPLEIVKGVADGITYYAESGLKHTKRLNHGMTVASSNFKYKYNTESGYGELYSKITVSSVEPESVAYKLGLEVGDVITALNVNGVSYKINMNYNLDELLYTVRAGDKIYFELENKTVDSSTAYTVKSTDLVAVG